MNLKSLAEATKFVTEELQRRGYEIRSGVLVNERRNALYTTTNPFGFDESFFLKYEKNPFFTLGYEVDFPNNEKKGVTINKAVCERYIIPSQANILYANPEMVYHLDYVIFTKVAIDHIQRTNNEAVMAIAFSKFIPW